MKINKFIAFLYMFLLVNSSILAIKEKASMTRRKHHRSRVSHHKKSHSHNKNSDECEKIAKDSKQIKIVPFIFNFIDTSLKSFSDSIVDVVSKTLKVDKISQVCNDILEKRYDALIDKIIDKEHLAEQVAEKFNNLSKSVSELGESKDEKEDLASKANNPKALCKASSKILERQKKDSKRWKEKSTKVVKTLDENIADPKCVNIDCLEKQTKSIFGTKTTKIFLHEFVRDSTDSSLPFKTRLSEARSVFNESFFQALDNKKAAEETDNPNCSSLPETCDELGKCVQIGFATKVLGAWRLITDLSEEAVKTCILTYIGTDFITRLITIAVEKVISIVINIFGLLAFKIIKVVFFAARLLNYLYIAKNEKEIIRSSEKYGKAAGTVVQIASVLLFERRRRMLKRMMK